MAMYENEKWVLNIHEEEEPQNPREAGYDDGLITKMVCFHSRHKLGDDHDVNFHDYNSWNEMKKAIVKNENVLAIKPLYLFDHSGLTVSTSPFQCSFDSMTIGFVFITKERMRETFNIKRCTKKWYERALKEIEQDVKTYDQYLTGDTYWISITNKETEESENFGTFYGDDFWENGMSDNVYTDCIKDFYPQLKAEYGPSESYEKLFELA